jgi:hypothetical protein
MVHVLRLARDSIVFLTDKRKDGPPCRHPAYRRDDVTRPSDVAHPGRWSQADWRPASGRSEVGSTPTGDTFKQAAGPVGPAACPPRRETIGRARPVQGIETGAGSGRGSSVGQSTRLITWTSRVRLPPTTRRNRLSTDSAETWQTSPTNGPEGDGPPARSALPRSARHLLGGGGRQGRAAPRDAPKHADSAALRRRRGGRRGGWARSHGPRPRFPIRPDRGGPRPGGLVGSSVAPRPVA